MPSIFSLTTYSEQTAKDQSHIYPVVTEQNLEIVSVCFSVEGKEYIATCLDRIHSKTPDVVVPLRSNPVPEGLDSGASVTGSDFGCLTRHSVADTRRSELVIQQSPRFCRHPRDQSVCEQEVSVLE